ncbi:hypothetical protein ACIPX0_41985 [Streptomyces sp. NPDC090075]
MPDRLRRYNADDILAEGSEPFHGPGAHMKTSAHPPSPTTR